MSMVQCHSRFTSCRAIVSYCTKVFSTGAHHVSAALHATVFCVGDKNPSNRLLSRTVVPFPSFVLHFPKTVTRFRFRLVILSLSEVQPICFLYPHCLRLLFCLSYDLLDLLQSGFLKQRRRVGFERYPIRLGSTASVVDRSGMCCSSEKCRTTILA